MRLATVTAIALAGALTIANLSAQQPPAQPTAPPAGGGGGGRMQMNPADAARKVPGGGVFAAGWKSRIDPGEAKTARPRTTRASEGSGGTTSPRPRGISLIRRADGDILLGDVHRATCPR